MKVDLGVHSLFQILEVECIIAEQVRNSRRFKKKPKRIF